MRIAYKPGDSFFHKTDPIMKFLWVLTIGFWLYSLRELGSVIIASLSTAIFSLFAAKLELEGYLKITVVVFMGSTFIILYQGIFRPGSGIDLGPIVLSFTGMKLGLAIGLRTFGLVASSLAFSHTTSPQDLELSLVKIGVPYKISHISYLALRLLPIFQKDMQTVQDIQTLRNVKKGWDRIRVSIIALIVTELRQADNIAIALETRGFGLYNIRTEIKELTISVRGITLVLCTIALIVLQYAFEI